ncbi:unnamed protein product [Auanema sp. JU1783]|nr:unnamed protein product [Auanema sp. JU1783]
MSNRRYSQPNYHLSQPGHYYYDNNDVSDGPNDQIGGSFDENDRLPPGYGNLENATLRSEISMSVITDDTRFISQERRRGSHHQQGQLNMSNTDLSMHKRLCGIVNVEPVMCLFSISIGLLITFQPLFTYWARCVEIAGQLEENINENITSLCAQLSASNGTLQDLVESDISSTKIWLQIVGGIPTLLIAPLIGTWSDRRGRKLPLLYAMSGYVIQTFCLMMATMTYETWNVYRWYFVGEFVSGLTGGASSIFATSLAIVTDDCRSKLRPGSSTVPLRIGIASFLQSIGSLLGVLIMSMLAVPALVSVTGHSQSYVKAAFLQLVTAVVALLYTIVFVRETHFPQKDYCRLNEDSEDSTEVETKKSTYIMSLVEVIMEKRPGWTRLCLILSLFFVFVEFLSLDMSILFLLLKRPPFSWTDSTFSYYSLIRGAIFSVGMILCPLALTLVRWLGKDSIMIIMGISASAVSFFVISQAQTTQEIFITCGLALIIGGIAPGYRSFLPRMVPKEQTARLLTVCSIIMAICPIISSLVFNSLFNATMDWWPGFVFFIGSLIQFTVVFGQSMIHWLMRPQWRLEKEMRINERLGAIAFNDNYPAANNESDEIERSVSNTAVGSDLQIECMDDLRPTRPV